MWDTAYWGFLGVRTTFDIDKCTDISKITRKLSKTGKHGHEKRKSSIEAKDAKPKPEKVNLHHVAMEEYGRKHKERWVLTLGSLREVAQAGHIKNDSWHSLTCPTLDQRNGDHRSMKKKWMVKIN
ncbi:hypothetical protein Tco_1387593 [Tanacetum coccineum]